MLDAHDLVIENDTIQAIQPTGENYSESAMLIDAQGRLLTPGFIDIHSDYIEHMAAPRPSSLIDFHLALRETERELITHGITTMFHSLSIIKSTEFPEKPIRNAANTQQFVSLIDQSHHTPHQIRHRFHARFEIDSLDRIDELTAYIENNQVHLISFMDHTPGQGQYRDLENYKATLKGYRKVSDTEIEAIIQHSQNRPKMTLEMIEQLCRLAQKKGIAIASHDDDSADKLETIRSFGATISEFPLTLEVAREARKKGLHTLAGAPNVLLGGSHNGNLSAAEAIHDGCMDMLCSDYYPAAMLHSIFKLHAESGKPLHELFRLITLNPAKAVNLSDQLGSIEIGKKADLLLIDRLDNIMPVITHAFVDGIPVYQANYRRA
jgi:alpha-D-ribose 1-methylphosphonate 5-triphosphate diphosphatase